MSLFNKVTKSFQWGGKTVVLSTGEIARQASSVKRSAKSGQRRRSILTYSRDGDTYVVAGTAGGSPTTPSWVANLAAKILAVKPSLKPCKPGKFASATFTRASCWLPWLRNSPPSIAI